MLHRKSKKKKKTQSLQQTKAKKINEKSISSPAGQQRYCFYVCEFIFFNHTAKILALWTEFKKQNRSQASPTSSFSCTAPAVTVVCVLFYTLQTFFLGDDKHFTSLCLSLAHTERMRKDRCAIRNLLCMATAAFVCESARVGVCVCECVSVSVH